MSKHTVIEGGVRSFVPTADGLTVKVLSRETREVYISHDDHIQVIPVEEMILEYEHPLLRKLIWCLPKFEDVDVAGHQNSCFHVNYCAEKVEDFDSPLYSHLDAARRRVERTFVDFYRDKEVGEKFPHPEVSKRA